MTRIPELHVGRGLAAGPLTIFPVWADAEQLEDLSTGAGARVDVREVPGGAQVPHLAVTNRGAGPALLVEGELLEGGKQTRTLAMDLLIAPGATVIADVACVEQGRWHGGEGHERRARRASPSVQNALRGGGPLRQQQVWSSVARYEHSGGATGTRSLAEHLDRLGRRQEVRVLPGQSGVIIGIAGWPVSLELFGSRAALAAHLPGLVDAALLDATLAVPAARVPARRARRLAEIIEGIALDREPARAGDGYVVAGAVPTTAVRGLVTPQGQLAHLSALNLRHELIAVG